MSADRGIAVVTGASSGIGAATSVRLAAIGYEVWACARRTDRLQGLADAHANIRPVTLDVTDDGAVESLGEQLRADGGDVVLLVNNAGGARGLDPVETGDPHDWQVMYETNVVGTLRVTKALLPLLEAGSGGHVVLTGSIAGRTVYEGGAGYAAAKFAARALIETLRLELNGRPIRVSEVAPGMVKTDEFALVRFEGDAERAAQVYAGVDEPLTAEDVADIIAFVVTRPAHVNIDLLVVKPLAQAAPHKVARNTG